MAPGEDALEMLEALELRTWLALLFLLLRVRDYVW